MNYTMGYEPMQVEPNGPHYNSQPNPNNPFHTIGQAFMHQQGYNNFNQNKNYQGGSGNFGGNNMNNQYGGYQQPPPNQYGNSNSYGPNSQQYQQQNQYNQYPPHPNQQYGQNQSGYNQQQQPQYDQNQQGYNQPQQGYGQNPNNPGVNPFDFLRKGWKPTLWFYSINKINKTIKMDRFTPFSLFDCRKMSHNHII